MAFENVSKISKGITVTSYTNWKRVHIYISMRDCNSEYTYVNFISIFESCMRGTPRTLISLLTKQKVHLAICFSTSSFAKLDMTILLFNFTS